MADDQGPKPGHFLPGGAGDQPGDGAPVAPVAPRQGEGATPLTAPKARMGLGQSPTLTGTRLGPPPPDDPAAAAYKALYTPEPLVFEPRKRSKALIALLVVGVVALAGAGVFGMSKLVTSELLAAPLGTPTTKSGQKGPFGKPTPDSELVKASKLYSAGRLPAVSCPEPGFRPTDKEKVYSYYETLTACMDKAWEPVVRKAGFEFRSPGVVVFDEGQETACGIERELSSYCTADGGFVALPWESLPGDYEKNRALTRVEMAQALGYVYGLHLQHLAGIFEAADNLRDTAPDKAAQLEQDRRQALQASCLSAVFFGTVKKSFPLRGRLLTEWNWAIRHSGDEHHKDKVRDHGSAKSLALWMNRGFSTTDPGTCNTFVAAATQVS